MSAVGADDWLGELQTLKAGEGASREYRARCWEVRGSPPDALPPNLDAASAPTGFTGVAARLRAYRLSKRPPRFDPDAPRFAGDVARFDVGLYPLDAEPGALPLVVVPVGRTAPMAELERGATIRARGVAAPGHALVLEVDGRDVPCIGPAWVPTFFRSRRAL